MWCWLLEAIVTLGYPIVEAIVTAVVLSLGFMLFNDYIAPPPDLSGRWKFTITYKDTAYARYQGLQVTYQVLLLQEGLKLSGSGEKISEDGPTQEPRTYTGKQRTNIRITGTIKRKYFKHNEVSLHYEEEGPRKTSTYHQLVYRQNAMRGRYWSTIADTFGAVSWKRWDESCQRHEPMVRGEGQPLDA